MAKYFSVSNEGDIPLFAGEDLSASQWRYRFVGSGSVSASADTVVVATGASLGVPIGVLQDSACSAEEVAVRVAGFSKLRVQTVQQGDTTGASPIQQWDYLTSTSTGEGRKAGGAASPALARAMEALASGSAIIHVQILPMFANALAAS